MRRLALFAIACLVVGCGGKATRQVTVPPAPPVVESTTTSKVLAPVPVPSFLAPS